jgi:ABC-2 type transport system ATP-binding protein
MIAPTAAPVIDCSEISHRFGSKQALIDVSFSVKKGQIAALVGPNGAGKTTLLNILCGFLRPKSGQVRIFGEAPGAEASRARLSALPQDARFDPALSIGSQLGHYARLQGYRSAAAIDEVERVLAVVELSDSIKDRPGELSHGMAKRAAIAQALIGEPELILLDEPTAGLDPVNARNIRELVAALTGRATFIISSHNLVELDQLCDSVLHLEAGRLRESSRESDDSVAYLNVTLEQAAPSDLRQKLLALAGVEQVEEHGQDTFLLRYNSVIAPHLDAQLLQLLNELGISYRHISRGKTLEQKLFGYSKN